MSRYSRNTRSHPSSQTSFVTFSGRVLNLNKVNDWDIDILDIAEALSKQTRFNGHTTTFYSVAQHSVIVSKAIRNEINVHMRNDKNAKKFQLYGLLHDAAEAYIGDIITPVKKFFLQENTALLEDLENRILNKVFEKVGLEPLSNHPSAAVAVEGADKIALTTEMRDLLKDGANGWVSAGRPEALTYIIRPQTWSIAMQEWLDLFEKLTDINPRIIKKAS